MKYVRIVDKFHPDEQTVIPVENILYWRTVKSTFGAELEVMLRDGRCLPLDHHSIGEFEALLRDAIDVRRDGPTAGSFLEALQKSYEAGGKAWDKVDDPEAFIRELRGE